MNPRFSFRDFNLPHIPKFDHTRGGRFYLTPEGVAPSASTIIGWAYPYLEDGGSDFRHPISPLVFGTHLHLWLEKYFKGTLDQESNIDWPSEVEACGMFLSKFVLNKHVSEVWGLELTVSLGKLYAGTADMVCLYDRVPTVIDYKTSLKGSYTHEEWTKYKLQAVAYALAFSYLTGERMNRVGILGVQRGLSTGPELKKQFVEGAEFSDLAVKWEKILDAYHAVKEGYWYE